MKFYKCIFWVTGNAEIDIFKSDIPYSFKKEIWLKAKSLKDLKSNAVKDCRIYGSELAKIIKIEHIVTDCVGIQSIRQTWEY